MTPQGPRLTFTEGETTINTLGENVFGIPSNGVVRPETPIEGAGMVPKVPMHLGQQRAGHGGHGQYGGQLQ